MKIEKVEGNAVAIKGNDIDTDRILPARFMKEITFENMGNYTFFDVRFAEDNSKKNHPFNDPKHKGASILIVNRNFGCGSSREHAPQSLLRFGIKAIVGESFAEIFAGNCQLLGIPCVTVSAEQIAKLQALSEQKPETEFTLDLESKKLMFNDSSFEIEIPAGRRKNLLEGTWDTLSLLVSALPKTKENAAKLPYLSDFTGSEAKD